MSDCYKGQYNLTVSTQDFVYADWSSCILRDECGEVSYEPG